GPAVNVAAVWTRDGRNWRMASGLTADEVRQQDEDFVRRGSPDPAVPGTAGLPRGAGAGGSAPPECGPVDVAGSVAPGPQGKPADRSAALWVARAGPDDEARMYVGKTAEEETEVRDRLKEAKLIARTMTALRGTDGRLRYCGVWGRPP